MQSHAKPQSSVTIGKTLWVGLGCRRGTSAPLFEYALKMVCQRYSVDGAAIAGIATLDLKQTEPGLLRWSLTQSWPLIYFTHADLQYSDVAHPSVKVEAVVGLSSVCEAAALKAAAQASPDLILPPLLMVPKQIFRLSTEPGAVTMAIATHPTSVQAGLF